jgi:hypothetical protein
MKSFSILILLMVFLGKDGLYPSLPKSAVKKMNKAISKTFDSETVEKIPVVFPAEVKETLSTPVQDQSLFWLSESSTDDTLGLLVLSSAKGRHDYFDYMVIYDTRMDIILVQILVYRSDHGHEITAKGWLKQFIGKDGCDLVYGQEIEAISGATYSGKSITRDINRLCDLLEELREAEVI